MKKLLLFVFGTIFLIAGEVATRLLQKVGK